MPVLCEGLEKGSVVGRTKRSAVPAMGRPAGTALRLVRPTDSTPIRRVDKALGKLPRIAVYGKALRAELMLIARLWPRVSAAASIAFGRPTPELPRYSLARYSDRRFVRAMLKISR